MMKRCMMLLILTAGCFLLEAQPSPGELFREYVWYNETGDCNGALRVGGRLDYQLLGGAYCATGDGKIKPDFDLDLRGAVRAEVVIEKMLCHAGTEGLRIIINDRSPLRVPEPEHIPRPQSAYAHHLNQVVPLDLSSLTPGSGNTFAFQVDTAGHHWPQHLVYGMILRIYHDPGILKEKATIRVPGNGDTLGLRNTIRLEVPSPGEVSRIDLIGHYEDTDLEGNGLYRQWHYGFHRGEIDHHMGSLTGTMIQQDCELEWNTGWIPDQPGPVKIAARVVRKDGYIYMTEAVNGLVLYRPGISVELCRPYDQPQGWFTREGVFGEHFRIEGDLRLAVAAKMVFRSWSPGYFNGICINDFLVFIREGPRYDYFEHHIPLSDLYVFNQGENTLKTGKTPLYHGEMVHGVEVQWPGIMILIRYHQNPPSPKNLTQLTH